MMMLVGVTSYIVLIYLIYQRKKGKGEEDYYFGVYIFFTIIGFSIVKEINQNKSYIGSEKELALLFYPLFFINMIYTCYFLKKMYSSLMQELEKRKKMSLFLFEISMFIILIVMFVWKTEQNARPFLMNDDYWGIYHTVITNVYRLFINENVFYLFFFGTLIFSHFSLMKNEKDKTFSK